MAETKYLLPCACGRKLPVEVAQAGEIVRCACGQSVTVPSLRRLRELEPANPQAAPTGAVAAESSRESFRIALLKVAFAASFVLLVGCTAAAVALWAVRMSVQNVQSMDSNLAAGEAQIDQMPVDETFNLWRMLTTDGLVASNPEEFALSYYKAQVLARYLTMAAIAAVVCLVLCCVFGALATRRGKRLR
jgi:hypothetical protein